MKKYTKITVIIVLLIVFFVRLDQLSALQSLTLLIFLIAMLYLFEKREVKRGFESGVRRLYICVDFDGVKRAINDLKKNALYRPMTKEAVLTLEKLLAFYTKGDQVVSDGLNSGYYRFWSDQVDFLSGKLQTVSISPSVLKKLSPLDLERASVSKCFMKDAIGESEMLRSEVSSSLLIAELSLLCATIANEDRLKQYYTKVAHNLSKGAFENVNLSEDEYHVYLMHQTC